MKKTKTYPNERLQLNDYEAVAKLVLDELIRSNRVTLLPQGRTTGAAATSSRILDGFNLTDVSGGTCRLTRGSGFFGYFDQGVLKQGILVGEDSPAYYDLDLSALPDGGYFIYARMVFNQTDAENRIFWNPTGTPVEYVDNVPTRDTPSWEYAVQATSVAPPGHGEWVKLWMLVMSAGNITDPEDWRHYYFEGDANSNFPLEWGSSTDRQTDRQNKGAKDFHWFAQAVRTQLGEIIGLTPISPPAWYAKREISLRDLNLHHYGNTELSPGSHRTPFWMGHEGDSQWRFSSSDYYTGVYQSLSFRSEVGANNAQIRFLAMDAGSGIVFFEPMGEGVALAGQMGFVLGAVTDPWWAIQPGTDPYAWEARWVSDQSEAELLHRMGSGTDGVEPFNGLHLGNNAGYYLTERTVSVVLPLQTQVENYGSIDTWEMLRMGTPPSDSQLYNRQTPAKWATLEYANLPNRCVLNYIDIMWSQASMVSSGTNMRLYVYKHTIGWTTLGDKPFLGNTTDQTALKTPNPYLEYALGSFSIENIMRFTCNVSESDRTFDQHYDKLVLSIKAPSSEAKDCYVYWIRANFTYKLAQPFPVGGTA